ncbi:MAG: ergothioneine biosynthesis protein EgtB [Thermoleophilaceae bacterium]
MRSQTYDTSPLGGVEPLDEQALAAGLEESRGRTLALVAPVSEQDLNRVHDPLMSPLVWDLGHIAAFEDLWIAERTLGLEPLRADLQAVYDADETPRHDRGELPYLRRAEAIEFMDRVRERTLSALAREERPGPIWDMVLQHEQQHNETMLQTLQLADAGVFAPDRRAGDRVERTDGPTLPVEAGPFVMGDAGHGFAYDNERPARELYLDAFEIGSRPVTNGDFTAFVEDGGYERPELWSESGWAVRQAEGWQRPLYWSGDGRVRRFERTGPLEPDLPVMHVSWYEADAFARWRGARLPTEAEWEKAARTHGGRRGNLDQLDFGPGPAGPFVGDCWEWTATDFDGYPGFRAFPYPEYSEAFFGAGFRVLRGAAWATRPRVARPSFRNWDHPQRRQIFSGFRCVVQG